MPQFSPFSKIMNVTQKYPLLHIFNTRLKHFKSLCSISFFIKKNKCFLLAGRYCNGSKSPDPIAQLTCVKVFDGIQLQYGLVVDPTYNLIRTKCNLGQQINPATYIYKGSANALYVERWLLTSRELLPNTTIIITSMNFTCYIISILFNKSRSTKIGCLNEKSLLTYKQAFAFWWH